MEKISSPVSEFYKGKIVFITGGTGFMGKVLIERLLSACPGIEKIYILIRPKKGEDMALRLAKVKENRVFEALKERHEERLKKLEALEGDLELPGLGLSGAARAQLQHVNVVLNVAATLNLNEELRKSLTINVLATRTLLEMCLRMENLKAFVHVSTAYANCDRKPIEERVYPSPVKLDELIQELEQCTSDQDLQALTRRVLGKRPNTYTLTKAMAENVVQRYGSKFPIAIVRPSLVTAALRSPLPGWVDTRVGPTGMVALFGSGLLRIGLGDNDLVLDMVPVDLVDNAVIVVGWRTACVGVADPIVYNVTSGRSNPVRMREAARGFLLNSKRYPLHTAVWYPTALYTTNRLLYSVGNFWLHLVPAYLYDFIVPSSGKRSLVQIHSIARKAMEATQVFLCTAFDFADDNLPTLIDLMSEQDRNAFCCDVKEIDWTSYLEVYVLGVRRYLLGQNDETLPESRHRMKLYTMQYNAMKVAAAAVACYLTYYYAIVNICSLGTTYG